MEKKQSYVAFSMSVIASVAGGLFLAAGSWSVSQSWFAAAVAIAVWAAFVTIMMAALRRSYLRNYVKFIAPMSNEQAENRIRSASQEIWSFQISGSEFTAHSVETYEAWLSRDGNHRLLIAFVNPENTDLLKNIVKLSGVGSLSSESHAYDHLRAIIKTALDKYIILRQKFGDRVDVRVYDFSPPYSVHIVDPDSKGNPGGSAFVELYLPDLPSRERPCMLLTHEHSAYSLYRTKSLAWFEAARRLPAAPSAETREEGSAAP